VLKQTLFDLLVYTPLWFFPNFYVYKSMIQGEELISPLAAVPKAIQKYKETWLEDNLVNSSIWGPVDIIQFSVPAWLRMPMMISVNFLYTMLLSFMRGDVASSHRIHVDVQVNIGTYDWLMEPAYWARISECLLF